MHTLPAFVHTYTYGVHTSIFIAYVRAVFGAVAIHDERVGHHRTADVLIRLSCSPIPKVGRAPVHPVGRSFAYALVLHQSNPVARVKPARMYNSCTKEHQHL